MNCGEHLPFQFLLSVLADCVAVLTLLQTLGTAQAEARWMGVFSLPHILFWLLLLRRSSLKWNAVVRRFCVAAVCMQDLTMLLYWMIEYSECQQASCTYYGAPLLFVVGSHFMFTCTDISYSLLLLPQLAFVSR